MRFPEFMAMEGAPSKRAISKLAKARYDIISKLMRGETIDSYSLAKRVSEATRLHSTMRPLVSIEELCE